MIKLTSVFGLCGGEKITVYGHLGNVAIVCEFRVFSWHCFPRELRTQGQYWMLVDGFAERCFLTGRYPSRPLCISPLDSLA